MTNEEILKKAFMKAIDEGWSIPEGSQDFYLENLIGAGALSFIFRHDFAKAIWGDDVDLWLIDDFGKVYYPDFKIAELGIKTWMSNWQYHLQKMVLEEDPIKYLEMFL